MPTASQSAKGQTGNWTPSSSTQTGREGRPFNFSKSFFADKGALIFGSLEDLVAGASNLHAHFARFGLLMHAGTRQADRTFEKSKTMHLLPASPNYEPDVLPEPFDISALRHIYFTREF
jgi:hypothetical protein